MGDSSERPGKEHRLKGLAGETQGFSVADLKPDPAPQVRRQQTLRASDGLGVWIETYSAPDDAGNPPSETAVTAADVEDPGPAQGRMPQERSHFHTFGIPSHSAH